MHQEKSGKKREFSVKVQVLPPFQLQVCLVKCLWTMKAEQSAMESKNQKLDFFLDLIMTLIMG